MKTIFTIALVIALGIQCTGQEQPHFGQLRFDDDFSYLGLDSVRTAYEKSKFMPLGSDRSAYLSFGGEVRYQYFIFSNEDWGERQSDNDGFVLSRFLAHLDLHITRGLRFFTQMQSSNATGRPDPSPVENNPLEIHQAFLDYRLELRPGKKLLFRAGRQEMRYGSQRLIAVREIPNNRRSFDGGRIAYESAGFHTDAFYTHPVQNRENIFDDRTSKTMKLWGTYAVIYDLPWLHNIDLYYLGLWNRNAAFDDAAGREMRHSFGTRVWKDKGDWQYDFEALWQIGDLGGNAIRAYTVSSNTTYRFSRAKFKPTIGLKTEVISGNRSYGDNRLESFNAMFPRGAYFGLAALIGPVNLFDLHPSVDFELTEKLTISLDSDIFWRMNKNDGLYAPNMTLIYTGRDSNRFFIGNQYSTELFYVLSDQMSIKLEGTWFQTGGYLEDSGPGKDIVFGGLMAQFRF